MTRFGAGAVRGGRWVAGGKWEVWLVEGQWGREREAVGGGGRFIDADHQDMLTIKIQRPAHLLMVVFCR
jgi:hypothetical protein